MASLSPHWWCMPRHLAACAVEHDVRFCLAACRRSGAYKCALGILPYLSGICPVCIVGDVMCADGPNVGGGLVMTAVENIGRNRVAVSLGLM